MLKKSKFDSDFEHVPNDFYRTFDVRAHNALNAHLEPGTCFAEPCYGYGDLVKGLEVFGHRCVWRSELIYRPEAPNCVIMDAFDLTYKQVDYADHIITNPPWNRKILHGLIEHFVTLKPTWLLFEADWAHTKQSSPYMSDFCTDIVSVGRMKWIEGSSGGSLKDCAWYKFDANKNSPTRFYGR